MEECELKSSSHKCEKVRSNIGFKLEVICYAETNSNHAAAKKYKIDRNSIRDWRKKRDKIEELKVERSGGAKQQRLDGGGRHLTSEEIEQNLLV